jgi:hypothetical protein
MFDASTLTEFNSEANSLTDAELDQVSAGFLTVAAGIAVGAVLGVGILALAVAVGDGIRHASGKTCIKDAI